MSSSSSTTTTNPIRSFPPALMPLVDMPRWIGWESRLIAGRDPRLRESWSKIARLIGGGTLKRREQTEWAGLREAIASAGVTGHGIGWVPKAEDGLLFLDIDKCRDVGTGAISEAAREVIERCASYAEISPSGTGIRIIGGAIGWGGEAKGRFRWPNGLQGEVYFDYGYVTVTMNWLDGHGERLGPIGSVCQSLVDSPENEVQQGIEQTSGTRDPARDRTAPIEVVRDLLRRIPNDGAPDWDRWIGEVGLAVWGATTGSEDGLAAWDAWSRGNDGYGVGETCEDAWWRIGNSPPWDVGAGKLEILAKAACAARGEAWVPGPVVQQWLDEGYRRKQLAWVADAASGMQALPRDPEFGSQISASIPVIDDDGALYAASPRVSAERMVDQVWGGQGAGRWLHHEDSEFIDWDGQRYVTTPNDVMNGMVWDFLHQAKTKDKEGKLVPFNPTLAKVANVVGAVASIVQLRDREGEGWPRWRSGVVGEIGRARDLMVFRNGLLNIETGGMTGHTPALLNRVTLPYDWLGHDSGVNGGCQAWLTFMDQLWPGDGDSIRVLQEMMGLFMTADTRFQKGLLLLGPPRSGRGTIGRVIRGLLGAENVTAPTLSTLGTHFGLAGLINKRLAIIGDMLLGRGTDGEASKERILGITGEDIISVPRKGREDWTGKLDVRFLALANKPPRLDDSSGAIMSRFIVLSLKESFLGREDRGLTERLLQELPGIAAWSLEGLRALRLKGHIKGSDAGREVEQEFRDLGDPVGQWLREECDLDKSGEKEWSEACTVTFNRWKAWCVTQGWVNQWSAQMFGRELRAAVPWITTIRPWKTGEADEARGRAYFGLRRKNTADSVVIGGGEWPPLRG